MLAGLTESALYDGPSPNPLDALPPRQRAVIALLGVGFEAKQAAALLHISRETLYQDRRRAWAALTPTIPAAIRRAYDATCRPIGGEEDSA